jgi:hypothetical protein
MTKPEWAVLLAVLCRRSWDHTSQFGWPSVNLWKIEFGKPWLILSVAEEEAP